MFDTFDLPTLRRQNLSYLVERFGQAEVARRMGKPDRQIADILAARASFGEKVTLGMERAWSKNTGGSIDLSSPGMIRDFEQGEDPQSVEEPEAEYVGPAPAQRLVAVIGQAQLGENGYYDLVPAGSDGYVEAISNDPEAYVLRVVGDSMFPAIRNGWYVLVEPNRAPHPTDYVAVAAHGGRKMVKEFLYRTETEVGLQSVNGGGRLTLPLSEVATLHPIGNLLSPSKHRAA